MEKITEKCHHENSSSSDSDNEKPQQSSSSVQAKIYRLFGREKPVHTVRGGGKPADIFLWRDKKISAGVLGGAMTIWVLSELMEYHLLTLVCHCDMNLITDDDFREFVDKVPEGCWITIVSDSCHNGGLIDESMEQIGESTRKEEESDKALLCDTEAQSIRRWEDLGVDDGLVQKQRKWAKKMGTGTRDSEEMKLRSEDEDKIHDAGERELFRDAREGVLGNRGVNQTHGKKSWDSPGSLDETEDSERGRMRCWDSVRGILGRMRMRS
ncbi:uncharacterized protein LOC120108866 [Phoenix dactylifera]|uniref:Reticulon-like protein n=1 Tax=Phoenix dactylifera TaxID=42345 RepID=A0A8B9A5G4_PHODC|nr:uncharacterized protein LOC120108866 [Phoenix dactylifera]